MSNPLPALDREIAMLLTRYPRVPIPGLGYILSEDKPASFDQVQGLLSPPGKRLSFLPCTETDNDLLINLLQQKYNLNRLTAASILDDYSERLQQELEERQSFINIEGVGSFYVDYKSELLFFEDKVSRAGTIPGFSPVPIQPFVRLSEEQKPEQGKRKALIKLPALFSLLSLCFVFWIGSQVSSEEQSPSDAVSIPVDLTDEHSSTFREIGTHNDHLFPLTVINSDANGIR